MHSFSLRPLCLVSSIYKSGYPKKGVEYRGLGRVQGCRLGFEVKDSGSSDAVSCSLLSSRVTVEFELILSCLRFEI